MPTNKIIYAKRKDQNVTLKGLFYTSHAKIKLTNDETIVEMNTKYRLPFYFILVFLVIFFVLFLFADNMSLNGNSDPGFLGRMGFVIVGLIMFSLPVGIFVKLKSEFVKQIEKKLKFKKLLPTKTIL